MRESDNTHETQGAAPHVVEEPYRDVHMDAIQRIEGGGPMRKVNMSQMPKPLRYFGYAVAAFMLACMAIFLISSWLT